MVTFIQVVKWLLKCLLMYHVSKPTRYTLSTFLQPLYCISAGSATDELILEAVPDALTTFPLRICKTMIYQVGSNLPCMQAIEDMNQLIQYNKSAQAGDFNDFAKFPVGPTCPVNLESPHSDANAFHALIIYELPVRTTAPKDSSVVVNGGVRVGGDASEAMWVSSATFKAETLPYEGPVKSVSGKFLFRESKRAQITFIHSSRLHYTFFH